MSPRRLLVALAATLALPAVPAAGAPPHGPTKLKLSACQAAVEEAGRFAVFEADMRSVPGAARMQMRLTLRARTTSRAAWDSIAAPGFGTWVAAKPGVRRLTYTKRVEGLIAPAQYRVVAKFRWLDAAGHVVARDQRRTPVCRQPDQRANLVPTRIDVEPGDTSDARTYVISVVNAGNVAAPAFAVRMAINGRGQPLVSGTALLAGQRAVVSLEAPACAPGSVLVVALDPAGVIDEADDADNTLTASCPSEA